jgi:tRNA modification GTPase
VRSEATTIVARSSGEGPAAIAVLRLAGPDAFEIARQCLPALPVDFTVQRLYLSAFVDAGGEPLDEVLVACFRGPRSYTGDDVVELSAHGSRAVVAAIQRRLVELGARPATAGEFTRRAVSNGRMDLVEAEALAAILEAEDEADLVLARAAMGQGAAEIRSLVDKAFAALAEARGSEDHPLETGQDALSWRGTCAELAERCDQLASGVPLERRLREGHRVVLLGPVNAGKSSLFNVLVGTSRALVDEVPGTTRDPVSASVFVEGKKVTFYDTAGLRDAEGVEQRGIEAGLEVAREADLVVWVQEAPISGPLPPESIGEIGVRVESKADRLRGADEATGEWLRVSAHTGQGIAALRARLAERLAPVAGARSARQQHLLREAARALREVGNGPDDLAAAVLERGVAHLQQLTVGAEIDLDEEVYRRFCIGK